MRFQNKLEVCSLFDVFCLIIRDHTWCELIDIFRICPKEVRQRHKCLESSVAPLAAS